MPGRPLRDLVVGVWAAASRPLAFWTVFVAFFLAITPNVGVTLWFNSSNQAAAIAEDRRKQRNAVFEELLSAASDVVIALYPPGAAPVASIPPPSDAVLAAERQFERLYWGRLGLVSVETVEPCLTSLHVDLLKAASGYPPSSVRSQALRYFQLRLDTLAKASRYDGTTEPGTIAGASLGSGRLDSDCRPA